MNIIEKLPKTIAGRYKLVKLVGEGGMGKVYLGRDKNLDNRLIAIKVVMAPAGQAEGKTLERFRNEMQNLTRLERHPNVVQVYDFGSLKDGAFYMAMSFVPGGSLQNRLDQGNWPDLKSIERILANLCEALQHMHALKIIHRDLKPANILIDAENPQDWGPALISDFGISLLSDVQHPDWMPKKAGTPGYRAPEQAQSDAKIDQRADIYALSVIAWQLYTRQDLPVNFDAAYQTLPAPLRLAIEKGLMEKPDQRYANVAEFRPTILNAPAPSDIPPYKGLATFQQEDALLFFGRKALVQDLRMRLGSENFLAIIGPSGIGKSSLVKAGLITALREDSSSWKIFEMTPGQTPLRSLASLLNHGLEPETSELYAQMLAEPLALGAYLQEELLEAYPGRKFLLVIDQLEQLAIQSAYDESNAFVQNLQKALDKKDLPFKVVATLRADFYDRFARPQFAGLRTLLQNHQCYIGEMSDTEINDAITGPGQYPDWQLAFEPGLVEIIIQDVRKEPGALPHFSQALLETWKRRRGRQMTVAGYQEAGGVSQAIATAANQVYEKLSEEQRAIAQRILLRLIQFGEGGPDTRRQQPVSELRSTGEPEEAFEETLQALAEGRLITLSQIEKQPEPVVDLAHDKLIAAWPVLQEWINKQRKNELERRSLEARAAKWVERGKGSTGLLDIGELAEAEHWMVNSEQARVWKGSQNLLDLLHTSREAIEQDELQKEDAHRREIALERQRATAQQRVARITRAGLFVVSILLVIVSITAFLAYRGENKAQQQTRVAYSRQLAAQARLLLVDQPQLSLLTAIQAVNVTRSVNETVSPETIQTALDLLNQTGGQALGQLTGPISALAISPDGRYLAAGSNDNGIIGVWNLNDSQNYEAPVLLDDPFNKITGAAFTPDNQWLITASRNPLTGGGNVLLWDLASITETPTNTPLPGSGNVGVVFIELSPDGQWLAAAEVDWKIRLWHLPNMDAGPRILAGQQGDLSTIKFDPTSHWLASGSYDGTVAVWDVTAKDSTTPYKILTDYDDWVNAVTFNQDGSLLAFGGGQKPGGGPFPDIGFEIKDTSVRIWSISPIGSITPTLTLQGQSTPIEDIAFIPGSNDLITSDNWLGGGTAWKDIRNLSGERGSHISGASGSIKTSPDGEWLTVGNQLLNLKAANGDYTRFTALVGHQGNITISAFSANGTWLASGGEDGQVRLWNLNQIRASGQTAVIPISLFMPDEKTLMEISDISMTEQFSDPTAQDYLVHNDDTSPTEQIVSRHWIGRGIYSPDGHWFVNNVETYRYTSVFERIPDTLPTKITYLWRFEENGLNQTPFYLIGQTGRVSDISFSPDSRYVYTLGDDKFLRIWDTTALQPLPTALLDMPAGQKLMRFSPNHQWLAVTLNSKGDYQVHLRHFNSPISIDTSYDLKAHKGNITQMEFSSDGKWLFTSEGDERLFAWDLSKLPEFSEWEGHQGQIDGMKTSSDSRFLLTINLQDQQLFLWDLTSKNLPGKPKILSGNAGAFSSDGRWLAISSLGSISVYDTRNLDKRPIMLRGPTGITMQLVFTTDTQWLIGTQYSYLGDNQVTIALWDINNPENSPVLIHGYQSRIESLVISPDGQWLFISDRNYHADFWPVGINQIIEKACLTAGRNHQEDEWKNYFGNQGYQVTCPHWPYQWTHISQILDERIKPFRDQVDGDLAKIQAEDVLPIYQEVIKLNPLIIYHPEMEIQGYRYSNSIHDLVSQDQMEKAVRLYLQARSEGIDPVLSHEDFSMLCFAGSFLAPERFVNICQQARAIFDHWKDNIGVFQFATLGSAVAHAKQRDYTAAIRDLDELVSDRNGYFNGSYAVFRNDNKLDLEEWIDKLKKHSNWLDDFNTWPPQLPEMSMPPLIPTIEIFSDYDDKGETSISEGEWGEIYFSGGYFVIGLNPGYERIRLAGNYELPENYVIQTEVGLAQGDQGYYGIAFNCSSDECLLFQVSNEGNYSIGLSQGASTKPIIDWTPSKWVIPYKQVANILAVEAVNRIYKFYINGTLIETLENLSPPGPYFGFCAINDSSSQTTTFFDNLVVGLP